ncbi:hypothetical protein [Actinocatenispora rupis]|uniref:DUF1453 domain-containing protein n=1 Tax=Actinocatenispora rupis TaxID=519421 RepID=A0A8J3J4P0_9ACTN|nr:hypothetical protein [Actinocatenispora rupis]GID12085.1 hypothetical protein Aru02nite_29740 [Actinocatenispora rupis]
MRQDMVTVAIVVLAVGFVLVRQFTVRRVTAAQFLWVVVLLGIGFVPPGPGRATVAGAGLLAVGTVLSAALGLARGAVMPLWRAADGTVVRRGDVRILLLWLATIVARLLVSGVAVVGFGEPVLVGALWLGFGVTLGAQQIVLLRRARRLPKSAAAPADPLVRSARD